MHKMPLMLFAVQVQEAVKLYYTMQYVLWSRRISVAMLVHRSIINHILFPSQKPNNAQCNNI